VLEAARPSTNDVLEILDDRSTAPDSTLPSTGIGLEWERLLSPPRVVHTQYGTRSTTAILFNREGGIQLVERGFDREGQISWQRTFFTQPAVEGDAAAPGWIEPY
jgi:uncharacterized protein with NRDE domain